MSNCEHKSMYGVYEIKNTLTGRTYIGVTTQNFGKRWAAHISELMNGTHGNKSLLNDWQAYEPSVFTFRILEVSPNSDVAYQREIELTDDCEEEMYNVLLEGGLNIHTVAHRPETYDLTQLDRVLVSGETVSPAELVQRIGASRSTINRLVKQAISAGTMVQEGRGIYRVV